MPKPKNHSIKLSVIIPCYNGAMTIACQLQALSSQNCSEPWEIIISNNGSTDNSMEIVESYRHKLPNLRVVDASSRKGQPYALNAASRAAAGESLLFCDADDQVAPGWLAGMGKALSKYDFVACRWEDRKLNEHKFCGNHAQHYGLQPYSYPPYLPHAGGGTLGVKRALYDTVGGFDESLIYLHDTDLCWKIQLTGKKLHFVPDAVIHIRSRKTLQGVYRQSLGYSEYKVLLYKKYRGLGMPKLTMKQMITNWLYLVNLFIQIRNSQDLVIFTRRLGSCMGRLKGSIKYRVFAL